MAVLGPIWRSTYPLVVPWMLFVMGQGIGFGVAPACTLWEPRGEACARRCLGAALARRCAIAGALTGEPLGRFGASRWPHGFLLRTGGGSYAWRIGNPARLPIESLAVDGHKRRCCRSPGSATARRRWVMAVSGAPELHG